MDGNGEIFCHRSEGREGRDAGVNGKSHSIAKGLSLWSGALNATRTNEQGIFVLLKVRTGVVIPIGDATGANILNVGDVNNWHEPSNQHLSMNAGWQAFSL